MSAGRAILAVREFGALPAGVTSAFGTTASDLSGKRLCGQSRFPEQHGRIQRLDTLLVRFCPFGCV